MTRRQRELQVGDALRRASTLTSVTRADRVTAIGEVLRAALETGLTDEQARQPAERLRARPVLAPLPAEPVRTFASAGTLSAESDLAERVEEILRTEPPGTAA